jgi:hypothetical protein
VNKTTNHNSLSFAFGNAWSTEAGRPIYAPSATTLLTLRLNLCCPAAELSCAGGVTTIAGDLGLARTGLFAKLTAIFFSVWWYTNTRLVSALRRTFASHQSSFRSWDFSRLADLTGRRTCLLSGDRCRCVPLAILLWQPSRRFFSSSIVRTGMAARCA